MKNWRTSLCGTLAALSLSGFAGLGLPAPWQTVLLLICAAALGGLGYHATDCARCPGNAARLAALAVVVVCVTAVAGCTLSHMQLGVNSPAFGKFTLGIGGGSIGKGQTNAVYADLDATASTQGTNSAPVASSGK